MIFRVFDIETIPDLTTWTPGAPTYKMVPGAEGGVLLEVVESFPPPQAQRVVAVSYVDVEFDPAATPKYRFLRCYSECRWSRDVAGLDIEEHKLLSTFGGAVTGDVHFVSWNGRTFDLPVIALRSLKHRLACKWYYDTKDVRYRYSSEGHLDLMDYWSDFGASRPMKLHDAARLIGLPGKTDMSGASIRGIYESTIASPDLDLDGIQRDVARYCLQDSIQTALLWVRSRHHVGKVTAETHNLILDTFSSSPSITSAITLDWDRLKL
jgi:predicted PolB exonuclease-like 3'-5' exonuclease